MTENEVFKFDEEYSDLNACLRSSYYNLDDYADSYYQNGMLLLNLIILYNISEKDYDAISNSNILTLGGTSIYPYVDSAVPAFFLFRHYIELSLKNLYCLACSQENVILQKEANYKDIETELCRSHKLIDFFTPFEKKLKSQYPNLTKVDKDNLKQLKKLVDDFNAVDPTSTKLRYPFDKDKENKETTQQRMKKKNLEDIEHANLGHFHVSMIKTHELIEYFKNFYNEKWSPYCYILDSIQNLYIVNIINNDPIPCVKHHVTKTINKLNRFENYINKQEIQESLTSLILAFKNLITNYCNCLLANKEYRDEVEIEKIKSVQKEIIDECTKYIGTVNQHYNV